MIDSQALFAQITAVNSPEEQARLMLNWHLSQLSAEMQTVLYAAAIPHWFNFTILSVLLDEETADEYYDDLFDLDFVETMPGRGYALHKPTRHLLLDRLWQTDEALFRQLSGCMADYCLAEIEAGLVKDERNSRLLVEEHYDSGLIAEEVYHRLVSDPDRGIERFQERAIGYFAHL